MAGPLAWKAWEEFQYSVETGKVLWFATASCITQGNNVEQSGSNMIDAIFSAPDKNRIADAGCPL